MATQAQLLHKERICVRKFKFFIMFAMMFPPLKLVLIYWLFSQFEARLGLQIISSTLKKKFESNVLHDCTKNDRNMKKIFVDLLVEI